MPGRRINLMLLHPLPVFGIHLRPFGAELGAAVAHLDVTLGGRILGEGAAARRVPPSRSGGKELLLCGAGRHGAGRHLVARHKGEQADEDGRHLPGRVERLGVEIGYRKTESRRRLEPAGWCVHSDGRRSEWVVGREY